MGFKSQEQPRELAIPIGITRAEGVNKRQGIRSGDHWYNRWVINGNLEYQ
jgi:hypothetical protein